MLGREIERLPTNRHRVALTFDCGANADGLPAIRRTLRDERAPATFFPTGDWVRANPAAARAIAADYPVGNHSNHHDHLTELSRAAVRADLNTTRKLIEDTTGQDPRPRFRFPYGESTPSLIGVVNNLGYGAFRWTVDTLGWKGRTGGQTAETVKTRVLTALQPGEIVLMHCGSAEDGSTLDADALPDVIRAIRAHGYGFTTLP
jgi:peptidoglycan/xylan/chitin deacetylase (PgdA/CDA1 family)